MAEMTMERILHVIPRNFEGEWACECVISDGPKTWFHIASQDTPEKALQGARDWLAMARRRLEAGECIP